MKRWLSWLLVPVLVIGLLSPLSLVVSAETPDELANYNGKVISIMGDSISTFKDYIPDEDGFNLKHYPRYPQSDLLTDVNETWWMQVLTQLDAKLGINESWRSTEIYNYINAEVDSVSYDGTKACMASTTRIQNLGANGTPDVILFYGGTNDITQGRPVGTFDPAAVPTEVDLTSVKWDTVADAYVDAIMRMQYYYPDAMIVAMFPAVTSKNTVDIIAPYTEMMTAVCDHFGVTHLDLRDSGVTKADLPDGTHPDAEGMDKITALVLETLKTCEIEAGETVVHSLTTELNGAKSSNGHYKGVRHGEAYTTTITGNELAVTVTMGGEDITASVYNDGVITIPQVTGDVSIAVVGKIDIALSNPYMQELPEDLCHKTNLWTLLEHDEGYYRTSAKKWAKHESNDVHSVTFAVNPGDRIWATSFQKKPANGNENTSSNGIAVTFFDEDGVLEALIPGEVYTEFKNDGYLTVPNGALVANIPMWNNYDTNELYILTREHSFEGGKCLSCGEVDPTAEHTYDNSCDTTCNDCGGVREIEHTYSSSNDTTCNVCGDVREVVITNIIVNGDFEQGASVNWNSSSRVQEGIGKDGTIGLQSVREAGNDSNDTGEGLYYKGSLLKQLKTNTTYELSFDYKNTGGGRGQLYFAKAFGVGTDGKKWSASYPLSLPSGEVDWTHLSYTFTTSATISAQKGYELLFRSIGQEGVSYYDNIMLVEVCSLHVYENDCDTTCNECSGIRTVNDHVYDDGCDTTCNVCNAPREAQHTYDNDCDTACNLCGAERGGKHTFTDKNDLACDLCGKPREKWDTNGDGVLAILGIGNSFSVDAFEYMYQIAQSVGVQKVVLGNLYIGSCTLEMHANNATGNKNSYTFYWNDSGVWSSSRDKSIGYALDKYDWDYVSMQQQSGRSGLADTYNEDLTTLINYVKERTDAQLGWHMTWAYQQDTTKTDFENYSKDQMTMYNAIVSTVQSKILTNENIEFVVPSGTAVQNARTSVIGDKLTRDGYHMSQPYGRYLTGLMFIKTVTGLDITNITYAPSGVSDTYKAIAIESVNNAAATPFAVTQSAFVEDTPEKPPVNEIPEGYIQLKTPMYKGAYWHPQKDGRYNELIDDQENSMRFFTTIRFTKEELPVGSIILLNDSAYQYRPDGWVTDTLQSGTRENNTSASYVAVTESWWGDYTIRSFNVSRKNSTSVMSLTEEEMRSIFQIYVPETAHVHRNEGGVCALCGKTVRTELSITQQYDDTYAAIGETVETFADAIGDGLTYQWYIKNVGQSKFSKSSVIGQAYKTTMSAAVNGRQVYCVVTDQYGQTVTTETVTLYANAAINKEPTNAYAAVGSSAKVTITAVGKDLKYQWYIKNVGQTKYSKSSVTKASYSTTMSAAAHGRLVYCVVTDALGNTARTKTVGLYAKASITKEPTNVYVNAGATAKVTVTALGNGLTYQWYIKNVGQTKYSKSSVTKAAYSTTMSAAAHGRLVYCVVTDSKGNTARTKAVVLNAKASITTQPTNVKVAKGKTAKTTVTAIGNGLTYQWYVKNVGQTKYSKSSVIKSSYSTTMSATVNGRLVYCIVTDKYGNQVRSKTVQLSMK